MCTPENIASRRLLQTGGAGQVDEQLQRLPRDPVLAVVDVQIADRQRQLGAARGILGEELAQVFLADLVVMLLQGAPRGSGDNIKDLLRIGSPLLFARALIAGHVDDPSAAGFSKV